MKSLEQKFEVLEKLLSDPDITTVELNLIFQTLIYIGSGIKTKEAILKAFYDKHEDYYIIKYILEKIDEKETKERRFVINIKDQI